MSWSWARPGDCFFHTNPDTAAFLAGLSVTGADVTATAKRTNSVISVGSGGLPDTTAEINPLGPFDVGAALGTNGVGIDDIQSTVLFLSHASLSLTNDLLTSGLLPGSWRSGRRTSGWWERTATPAASSATRNRATSVAVGAGARSPSPPPW